MAAEPESEAMRMMLGLLAIQVAAAYATKAEMLVDYVTDIVPDDDIPELANFFENLSKALRSL
jgi:hypothetical protein